MYRAYLEVLARHRGVVAFGFLATFFTNFGQTYFFGFYGAHFREAFDLSNAGFGTIYSGVTLCSALAIIAVGHVIDKVRVAPYAVLLCLLLALGCVLISTATLLPVFILGLWLVRFLSHGVMGHMSSTVVTRYVENGRGRGLSLASMGYPAGEILFPMMVTGLLLIVSWREAWLLYGMVYLFVALPLFYWFSKGLLLVETPLEEGVLQDKELGDVLRDPIFWLVLVATMLMPFLLTGVFFHQQWLMEDMGLSVQLFALAFICYGISSMISGVVSGHVVDTLGAVFLLRVFLVPFIIATVIFVLFPHAISLIVFMVAAAVTSGTLVPTRGSFLADRYGVRHLGAIKSLMTSSMVFATALSPALFGVIIDQFNDATIVFHLSWVSALVFLAVLQVLRGK